MSFRLIVLLLVVSSLLILRSSFAQFEWSWFLFDPIYSGNVVDALFELDDWEIFLDNGQNITGVDSGGFVALLAGFPLSDIILLSGGDMVNSWSWTSMGEMNSWTISDPVPHLILSEVYYDWTDEWIEITNIGSGNFQWNIILSWVKSTPVSLMNVSFLSDESKIFGDTCVQTSWNSFIGKTGLAFSMTDTAPINIHLIVSGQIEDSFVVDQYRVNKYNDKKTSFEKVGEISTRVQTGRIINAQSGYIINPGIYFSTGTTTSNISFSPEQSWAYLQLPVSCDSVDQRDLIKVTEIFPWNQKYPPYIELSIHDNISIDTVSISGNLLASGLEFSLVSWDKNLEKNTFLLLSATGFRQGEGINSVRNDDFYLLSTWNWLLITIGSWQTRRLLDIVYLSGNISGKSSYFWSTSQQCARIMDVLDDFSPGFEQRFLKYSPGITVTKIEYISVSTGNKSGTGSCQSPWPSVPFSWDTIVSTDISSMIGEYTIRILNIDYDPKGSDTNNEKITLLATHASGYQTPLNLSKTFRLTINGRNKTLSGILAMNVPTTFIKTFGFPNSTDSWQDVIVSLIYDDHVFDTYRYNPKKLSSQDEITLTTTGYTVSSVIDGDTFRIKYQGKTQSVRLLGIDAPESNKTRYKYLECFGIEAKNHLKSLIDKKKITLQFDPSQDQKDIYDRLLAYVFLDDENINQTMIEDGYAKEYTYKTAYNYQSQFKQAEQSAQEQGMWLWNESTCGVSLSGIQLTGERESTWGFYTFSGVQFTITYVLPNPKWLDNIEELWIGIYPTPALPITWRGGSKIIPSLGSGEGVGGEVTISDIDLSQGFSLRIGNSKKKIDGIVHMGQENILSGNLGLVNKAACVSLFYEEQELTKFCYGKPKEGQKIFASDQLLVETPQENLDILNVLQLKKIGNQLCIRYKEQSFLCKRIPASKAEIKTTQEQKLYKWFASLIKQYVINNWKSLYYETPLKEYFDLVAQDKKLIAEWVAHVNIYGQSVLITDLKEQLNILETTLPWIVALFVGENVLHGN